MTDRTSNPVSLPTWEECKARVDAETATPLEAFIYENEPALTEKAQDFVRKCIPNYGRRADEQFRGMLAALIAFVRTPDETTARKATYRDIHPVDIDDGDTRGTWEDDSPAKTVEPIEVLAQRAERLLSKAGWTLSLGSIAAVIEALNEIRAVEPRPAQNYHCNICGGDVRFPDGAKPSISIGPGNKSRLRQTDAPDDGAMRGIASEKASVPPCVYRTGCQNQEACKVERVCMADLAQKLRAQSAENGSEATKVTK